MKVLPFYIYGTVRTGQSLNGWVTDIQDREAEPALCMGTELWTQKDQSYPYLVETIRQDAKTLGELMYLRNSKRLADLCNMEVAVGYTLGTVELITNESDSIHALTFLWQKPTSLYGLVPLGVESWLDRPKPVVQPALFSHREQAAGG